MDVSHANRWRSEDEFRELLAIDQADDENKPDDTALLALLLNPAHQLSMDMRAYLVSRITKRPAHRPKKTIDQSRAETFIWRAVKDARRIEQLLGKIYPQRRRGFGKVADDIAAARWGIEDKTVRNEKKHGPPAGRCSKPALP